VARTAGIPELRDRALATEAEMLLALGREAEADEVLAELTAGGEREALLLAAEVCQREEDFARSIPFLERLGADGHEDLQILFWLGAAYERTGRPLQAEEQFRRFLEREPDSAPALNYLGYMFADAGTNLDEALDLIERAVELDPDNGAYVDSLGWAHFRLGNYDEARLHLERAAELVGEDAVVLEHLGDVYEVLGEREDAVELYRRALELEGENADELRAKLDQLDRP
jgi:tetratricopeptide (TPR) repeat protein